MGAPDRHEDMIRRRHTGAIWAPHDATARAGGRGAGFATRNAC